MEAQELGSDPEENKDPHSPMPTTVLDVLV